MSKRPPISEKTKVDVAIQQAQDGALTCRLCQCRLRPGEPRTLEHNPPRALLIANGEKEPDHPRYLEWVHRVCAAIKTRGCEGTSKKGSVANGDTHRIRKAARIADGGKKVRKPFPKVHRPMQSHVNAWGKR